MHILEGNDSKTDNTYRISMAKFRSVWLVYLYSHWQRENLWVYSVSQWTKLLQIQILGILELVN